MEKYKAILAGFAAALGAGGIAAYNGVFTPETPPAAIVSQTAPANGDQAAKAGTSDGQTQQAAAADPAKPADAAPAAAQPEANTQTQPAAEPQTQTASASQAAATAAATAAAVTAPTFDILRVEPTGSVLIAGKAAPEANVEILNGAEVVGKAKAEMNGDFAIVLDKPLKPGDYQLVLRSTKPDGTSANSVETATVSVPEQANGPVLALVEEPGKPSRIITADEGAAAKVAVTAEVPAQGTVSQPAAGEQTAQAATQETAPSTNAAAQTTVAGTVSIEAVEVEGSRIFVAGAAGEAKTVRVYANDQLLGDAQAGADGRYLLDMQKDMAPGDYIIRAEGLAADGTTVLSRVSVPFKSGAAESGVANAGSGEQPSGGDTAGAPAKKSVIIRRGDTLWQISRRIYGRGIRYSTIYTANQDVTGNPNRIFPGQVFTIPEKTPEGDEANAEEIEKRAAQPE